jgi:hypothetical protein
MKAILSLAVLTLLVSGLAFAQSGASAAALGSFDVGAGIEISPSDGAFGVLSQGTSYTVTADGQIAPANADGDVEVDPIIWEISGSPGANVLITFALPAYFEGAGIGGGGVLVPYSAGVQSAGWADATFAAGDPYNPIDPRVPNTIVLIAGEAAVQLGGIISVPATAPEETYEGQFVLTAAYVGL